MEAVPEETRGIDRLLDGLIGAAIGLVIVAVFARASVCHASAHHATAALLRQSKGTTR